MFTSVSNSLPERQPVAMLLLKIMVAFGPVVAVIDLMHGNYASGMASVAVAVSILIVMMLARNDVYSDLPLQFAIWLLFVMYLVGAAVLLPRYPEKNVWVAVFPFAYFYLAGLRTGMLLSAASLLFAFVSYGAYPYFNDEPRISFYSFSQVIGAFLLGATFACLYEQAKTRQEYLLKESAESDPLTTLLNRRGFVIASDSFVRRSSKKHESFSVVLIDVDDFKKVNDSFGHDAGDKLLREIADILRSNTRSSDIVSRWGGEEFILLLEQSEQTTAHKVSEKLRLAISSYKFSTGHHTASFGVAIYDPGESLEDTIRRADLAMYRAKEAGKNKVVEFLCPSEG